MLIKACLNGGTTRDEHSAVPRTPAGHVLSAVADARRLASGTFADRILRVLLEPADRNPGGAVATARETSAELTRLGIDVPQVHHGYGLATWDVIKAAASRGFGIRVGLEDTTVLPDGSTTAGNGELVAAAVRLVQSGG